MPLLLLSKKFHYSIEDEITLTALAVYFWLWASTIILFPIQSISINIHNNLFSLQSRLIGSAGDLRTNFESLSVFASKCNPNKLLKSQI